jgi:HEAT repeat protein
MRDRIRGSDRARGFQDGLPKGDWSPGRQRLTEQVGLLVKALRSTQEGVQELAVVQISLLGPKVVPYLASALEDALDESDLRQLEHESVSAAERGIAGICGALGIIRDSDSVMDLASALPRKEAVEALSKIGGDRALDLIMDTVEGEPALGGPMAGHGARSSWSSGLADADPEFVRRVFLRFGEAGRNRLEKELAEASGPRHAAVAEIVRIMGDSDGLA